jgi:hypothetical protein
MPRQFRMEDENCWPKMCYESHILCDRVFNCWPKICYESHILCDRVFVCVLLQRIRNVCWCLLPGATLNLIKALNFSYPLNNYV